MIFKIILLFYIIIFVVTGKYVNTYKENNDPPLKWASAYSIEARKYYMSSGLIEDFKYWRTSKNSRLERNDGAVIKLVIGTKPGIGKYEIHPETTEKETNKILCFKQKSMSVSPENLLPFVRDLSKQGTENVRGIDCVKFTNTVKQRKESGEPDFEKTLWAYYQNDTDSWVPVRYKTKEIDEWHGYFNNYEMWDFFNFNDKVDLDVFKITYNCTTRKNNQKSFEKFNSDVNSYLLTLKPEEIKTFGDAFSAYKRQFGEQYTNREEDKMRKRIFYKSWRLETSTNSKNLGYKPALNKVSDGIGEDQIRYKGQKVDIPEPGNIPFPYSEEDIKKLAANLPKEYDLRVDGLVGPVLDRLSEGCESAWAFAVTAAVEGAVARSNGGIWKKLSEQALIDCSWGYGNKGCKGGNTTKSYLWIMEHGLPLQQRYGAYTNTNGFCKLQNMTETFKINGYTDVTPNNIDALKIALINHGPVLVNVYDAFYLTTYDGGVIYDESCDKYTKDKVDKVPMVLVGYGEKDGDTFWVLKDSKGPHWGIDGYIYISARNNNCGVMNEATYAVAKKSED